HLLRRVQPYGRSSRPRRRPLPPGRGWRCDTTLEAPPIRPSVQCVRSGAPLHAADQPWCSTTTPACRTSRATARRHDALTTTTSRYPLGTRQPALAVLFASA